MRHLCILSKQVKKLHDLCGHCGADIQPGAKFCKACGSSEADGWSESDSQCELDEDFDYDEFVEHEFNESKVATKLHPIWKAVALLLVLLFALSLIGSFAQ